ncbi:glycosyltransferase [Angustibacter aerolatus]
MIGWYVHHHGAGHRQRLTAVAEHLREPVTGLSSLPAPPGWRGDWVLLPRDDGPGTADADPTAHGVLHWAPRHHEGLLERAARLTGWLHDARPALVVVDVSVEVTLLTRLAGVPVAVAAMLGDRTDRAHRLAHDVADLLLAPWPARTEPGWPDDWQAKTVHVGAFSRFDAEPPPSPERLAAARAAWPAGAGRRVLAFWGSGGDDVAVADRSAVRERTAQGWRWLDRGGSAPASPDLWAELHAADVVVTHAGHNAVAEVAAARRPAVVVAQRRPHDEQVARARLLHDQGLAVALDAWPRTDAWPALLDAAADAGGAAWARWSPGDGARAMAAAVDALAATPSRRDASSGSPGSAQVNRSSHLGTEGAEEVGS